MNRRYPIKIKPNFLILFKVTLGKFIFLDEKTKKRKRKKKIGSAFNWINWVISFLEMFSAKEEERMKIKLYFKSIPHLSHLLYTNMNEWMNEWMCEYLFILLSYKFFIPPAGIHCILSGKSELVRKGIFLSRERSKTLRREGSTCD